MLSSRRGGIFRTLRNDKGVAMVMVLGVAGVLAILAIVVSVQSVVNLQQAGNERAFEQALQNADAGIDRGLYLIKSTKGTYNDTVAVASDARDDVLAAANAQVTADPTRLINTNEGQWTSIVKSFAGNKTGVIYSVGWIPSRADPRRLRVIRAEWDIAPFNPDHAILTNGDLDMGGSAIVDGSLGSAHANGDVDVDGVQVELNVSGSSAGGFTPPNACTTNGWGDCENSGGGRPPIELPAITVRDYFDLAEYVLCPDNTVRPGALYDLGTETPNTGTPCSSGDTLATVGGSTEYRGWSRTGSGVWTHNADPDYPGVYYVYGADVSVTGGGGDTPWMATLIAEATNGSSSPNEQTDNHTHAVDCGHVGGNINLAGNGEVVPHSKGENLLAIAGTDIDISGSAGAGGLALQGFLAAHEQFDIAGTTEIVGAVVAEDACHTSGSPAGPGSELSGNAHITFEGDEAPLGTVVRTTLWQELS